MKRIITRFYFFAMAVAALASCAKDFPGVQKFSSAVFVHASPATPPINILVDTVFVSTAPLNYLANTGYQGFDPGTRRITFVNQSSTGRSIYADLPNENFEEGKAYSYYLYDTLSGGRARTLRLNDDISAPAAGDVRIRVVHLAPMAGPVDVTLVRGTQFGDLSVGAFVFTPTDSITFSNITYVGNNPDVNALSGFRSAKGSTGISVLTAANFAAVPEANRNNRYFIKVKQAGTQNVLLQNVASGLPSTNTLIAGRAYTVYVSGTVRGVPAGFGVFQNFQF